MYCPNCGESLPDQALFCFECGTSIPLQKPNITEHNSNQPNNNQYSNNQYSSNQHNSNPYNNNQQIESPYEMIRLGEPRAPHRNVFVIIAIVVVAIILLSTIIIFALQGKNENNDRQDTKETYIEENQPEKVLEQDIYEEEVFTEEAFTAETEKRIEEPKGELTAQDIEGQWQVSLYDDSEYRHKEVWIWIVTPTDDTNFIINFPPDELFDEELDTEGIEGIEDVIITARLEKSTLYVKLPTDDTIPVTLAVNNGKLQGEGKLIIGDPEGDITIMLEMLKEN